MKRGNSHKQIISNSSPHESNQIEHMYAAMTLDIQKLMSDGSTESTTIARGDSGSQQTLNINSNHP